MSEPANQIEVEIPPARPRRYVVVINPATKGDSRRLLAAFTNATKPEDEITIHETRPGPDPLAGIGALDASLDAVVAIGGDGTVAAVAGHFGESSPPLGIIVGGSTNIIARELGIPFDAGAAARLITGAHRLRRLDAGICGNRTFLHMAGSGLDSRFFLATDPRLKKRAGWIAYLRPAFNELFAPPTRYTVTAGITTITLTAPLVLVANGGGILHPKLAVVANIRNDDGWLDILVFTSTDQRRKADALVRWVGRRLEFSPHLVRMRERSASITASPPAPVELDGDVVTMTPVDISMAPDALRVIVPPW